MRFPQHLFLKPIITHLHTPFNKNANLLLLIFFSIYDFILYNLKDKIYLQICKNTTTFKHISSNILLFSSTLYLDKSSIILITQSCIPVFASGSTEVYTGQPITKGTLLWCPFCLFACKGLLAYFLLCRTNFTLFN